MPNNLIWIIVGVLAAIALIIFIVSNVNVDENAALVAPGMLALRRS